MTGLDVPLRKEGPMLVSEIFFKSISKHGVQSKFQSDKLFNVQSTTSGVKVSMVYLQNSPLL